MVNKVHTKGKKMITEIDELKCRNSFENIDASELEPKLKSELKEALEEAKLNLNGRSLEDRVLSIAKNQFNTTRFLADIIIQFHKVLKKSESAKAESAKRTWQDVIIACRNQLTILGGIVAVCSIFQKELVSLISSLANLVLG